MLLYQILASSINGKTKKKQKKKNKFKISAPTWNAKFELPDGLYSILGIQGYFEYIIKNHEKVTDNSSVRAYV